jgi:hypothetical protein
MAYVWKIGALAALGLAGAGAVAVGCAGGESASGDKAKGPEGVRSTAIEHEPCEESGHKVDAIDVTNDGKPDIKKVFDGTVEICRITDLNHDGHADLFEYFDKAGQLRRREFDFDDNGVVNQIDSFEGGKLATRLLDTSNQGRIDTWDTFDPATGARVKRERDATGDGRIDQWWTYEGADKVTIAMDRNGDGLPDPEATIVLGGDGKPTSPDAGAVTTSADAGSVPPPPPPPAAPSPGPGAPGGEPASPLTISDAGVPGKPQRGGAKR